jgi:hypothetical protein
MCSAIKPVGQFGHREDAPFGDLLPGGIISMRYRTQDCLGARPGALWSDFADCGGSV